MRAASMNLDRLKSTARDHLPEFLKFGTVGGVGTLINLAIFYGLVDVAGLHANFGAVVAFAVAVTNNYVLNHLWTFRRQTASTPLNLRTYLRFVAVSLVGLAVNLVVLNVVMAAFHPRLAVIAQAWGILAGLVFNYLSSKWLVFGRKRAPSADRPDS